MLAVAKRMATIRFTPAVMSFHHGAVTVWVQLTQGEFPNYQQLIPTNLPLKVSFDAEEALRALRSLQDITSAGSGIVRLDWSNGSLTMTGRGEELGVISASVRAHIQGEEARIAFNIRYLLEYLAGKPGMVLLETAAPSSPARFFHSGSPDVLLMPMFASEPTAPTAEPAADQQVPTDEEAPEEPTDDQQAPGDEEVLAEPATAKPRARARRAKR